MKYGQQCDQRKAESADDRLVYCMGMLYLNGFMTDAEKNKVYKRLCKWARGAQTKESKGKQ